jgi:RNA polymerase sigma-70 factor (ECF subfamily)
MTLRDLAAIHARADALDAAAIDVPFQMDEETFRGFYERTARALWVYLHRLTGNRALADDLLQDAYYRLLRADVAFESEAHRRRYLFRIATNLVRDGVRRQRARPPVVTHDETNDAGTRPPDSSLNHRLDLTQALRRLGKRERAMLLLAYSQGSTHEEIAAVVGVKTSSVKPLLFRARRKLAGLLGRGGRS